MVKYSTQKPCEALSDYVRFFWTLEAKRRIDGTFCSPRTS